MEVETHNSGKEFVDKEDCWNGKKTLHFFTHQ